MTTEPLMALSSAALILAMMLIAVYIFSVPRTGPK